MKVKAALIDKAVLNNARQLAAAADQYYLEPGATSVSISELVGPSKYIRELHIVASESYPTFFKQLAPITVTGIADARSVEYQP